MKLRISIRSLVSLGWLFGAISTGCNETTWVKSSVEQLVDCPPTTCRLNFFLSYAEALECDYVNPQTGDIELPGSPAWATCDESGCTFEPEIIANISTQRCCIYSEIAPEVEDACERTCAPSSMFACGEVSELFSDITVLLSGCGPTIDTRVECGPPQGTHDVVDVGEGACDDATEHGVCTPTDTDSFDDMDTDLAEDYHEPQYIFIIDGDLSLFTISNGQQSDYTYIRGGMFASAASSQILRGGAYGISSITWNSSTITGLEAGFSLPVDIDYDAGTITVQEDGLPETWFSGNVSVSTAVTVQVYSDEGATGTLDLGEDEWSLEINETGTFGDVTIYLAGAVIEL
jgi:hypothetical protein